MVNYTVQHKIFSEFFPKQKLRVNVPIRLYEFYNNPGENNYRQTAA